MRLHVLCIAVVSLMSATPVCAAPREDVLFEVSADFDKNGVADRAALVLLQNDSSAVFVPPVDTFIVEDGQRVDLLIFLNQSVQPSLRKEAVVTPDGLRFAMPLETNGRGSLHVITSNGFGNTFNTTETLTIAYRDSQFIVAGFATDWYAREEGGHCSINFLSGKAIQRGNNNAKNQTIKGDFKQKISLAEWSTETKPKACENLGEN